MSQSIERPFPQSPERRLSAREFDQVIRRAAELHAATGESAGGSITEADALRIGRSLGLSTECLLQALSDTPAPASGRSGLLARVLAPDTVRACRAIRGEPGTIARALEHYLVRCEHLVVLRRLDDHVIFTRAIGVPAALKRAASRVARRSPLLAVRTLDVAVHPLDEGTSYVSLSTAVRSTRTITAASAVVGSCTGAAAAAALAAVGAAPEAALLAVPALGAGMAAGGRAHHRKGAVRLQTQLESLLDRVEHGELSSRPVWTLPHWWVAGRRPGIRHAADQ